jgi:hypothetical protein
MKRELFSIWEELEFPVNTPWVGPWRAHMVNYVAHFDTREEAEKFVDATKRCRAQDAKAVK